MLVEGLLKKREGKEKEKRRKREGKEEERERRKGEEKRRECSLSGGCALQLLLLQVVLRADMHLLCTGLC